MPYPGTVNNPGGSNSYISARGREEPYGAIERRKVLTRLAPLPPNPALTAPDRAQKAGASRQPQAPPEQPIEATAAQQAEVDEAANRAQPERPVDPVADFWQQLAAEPGASELVRAYAAQAAGQA